MMAVKFSFLALFKRLIDQIYCLKVYWWVVVAFNLAVTAYGAAAYIIPCPEFRSRKMGRDNEKVPVSIGHKLNIA